MRKNSAAGVREEEGVWEEYGLGRVGRWKEARWEGAMVEGEGQRKVRGAPLSDQIFDGVMDAILIIIVCIMTAAVRVEGLFETWVQLCGQPQKRNLRHTKKTWE